MPMQRNNRVSRLLLGVFQCLHALETVHATQQRISNRDRRATLGWINVATGTRNLESQTDSKPDQPRKTLLCATGCFCLNRDWQTGLDGRVHSGETDFGPRQHPDQQSTCSPSDHLNTTTWGRSFATILQRTTPQNPNNASLTGCGILTNEIQAPSLYSFFTIKSQTCFDLF